MLEKTNRIPAGYSTAFRLPDHLYKEAEAYEHTISGYRITEKLFIWLKENGLVNYRKNYNDVRDFFCGIKFYYVFR